MHLIARPARRCLRGGVAFALVCFASVASADVAFPDELPPAVPAQQSAPLPLTVAEDAATPVHRIVIPKTVLAKLAGDLPDTRSIASARHGRSIVAALALSAAVACGLVASRRGRPGRLAAAAIIGLVAAAGMGLLPDNVTLADRAPLPQPIISRPIAPLAGAERPESVVVAQGGKVILEIGPAGAEEAIVLVVGTPAAK
jgi:hypothetical protein